MKVRYQLDRPKKRGPVPLLEDPQLRAQVVAVASTGASRRGVAAVCGVSEAAIRNWVERGAAQPEEEPYGSFSRQYRMAERGLEIAASRTEAMRTQVMAEQMQEYLEWRSRGPAPLKPVKPEKPGRDASDLERADYQDLCAMYEVQVQEWEKAVTAWATPPPHPDVNDLEWLGRIKQRRFPEDWGTSKHRKPEPEFDGAAWLESTGLQREQLGALFDDPPEPIRQALVDKAAIVYHILVQGGFDPTKETAHASDPDDIGADGVRSAGEQP